MNAIVTGGTRGVGFELVKYFTKNNIPTIFTGRNKNELNHVEHVIDTNLAYGIHLDLTDTNSIQQFLNRIDSMRIDPTIIVHNAGYLSVRPNEKLSNIHKLFLVNSIGPISITEHFLPKMKQNNNGHLIFNSPPIHFDRKMKFMTPYLQSKFSQTTYMKSLAYTLRNYKISSNSMWTGFPLWTDAIEKRKIGTKDQCVHPSILSHVVDQIIFSENPMTFKGHELIDKNYLKEKNIPVEQFYLGKKSGISLEELFSKQFAV